MEKRPKTRPLRSSTSTEPLSVVYYGGESSLSVTLYRSVYMMTGKLRMGVALVVALAVTPGAYAGAASSALAATAVKVGQE